MQDPIFPCPKGIRSFLEPIAAKYSLPTFPIHAHEILLAFTAYHLLLTRISPWASARLFPKIYPQLSPKTKLNWDVHVVSLVQALFISGFALWLMFFDDERAEMHHVFGYTGSHGALQGFAAGYFLWDLFLSVLHYDIFGPGFTAHAICALTVFMLGFRPFVNYYGPVFILFELSNPFLNFHWFFDKLKMTGGRAQLVNGILLIAMFFSCRVVWGTINTFRVFGDVWEAYNNVPEEFAAQGQSVPIWLAVTYLGSNSILNFLNYYWFTRMIQTLRSRFEKPATKIENPVVEGTEVDLTETAKELKELEKELLNVVENSGKPKAE